MKKKRFGELLIDKGLIDQRKLDHALSSQGGYQKKLGETMVALGYMSEPQLAKILGDLAGIPAIDLAKFKLERECAKYVPGDFCAKHRLIPIAIKNHNRRDHLIVAFSDPLDLEVIDELRFIVSLPIFRVSATPSAVKTAILDLYPNHKPDSTIPGSISVSGPIDGRLGSVDFSASAHAGAGEIDPMQVLKMDSLRLERVLKILIRALADRKHLSQEQVDALHNLLGNVHS